MTLVARTGYDVRPFAHRGETLSCDFQSAEREMSFLGGAGSAQHAKGKVTLFGEGLQQAYDVAVNATPVPDDGWAPASCTG